MDQPTPEGRRCAVCGGPLRKDSRFGICTRTLECSTARNEATRRARGIEPRRAGRNICTVARCREYVQAHGLCELHDRRKRENGNVGTAEARPWHRVSLKTGDVFGNWTLLADCSSSRERVPCRCACGKERPVMAQAMITGWSTSCGCSRAHPHKRTIPYMPAGTTFGMLTALEDAWTAADRIRFRCECGKESSRTAASVGSGGIRSCGCLRLTLTHGLSYHPLYHIWNGIIDRTCNTESSKYAGYGGRGIGVCERWRELRLFVEDIERDLGPRPPGMSLDRIDNDGSYEPGNVRWADRKQQARNRRTIAALTAERDALLRMLGTVQADTGRLF